MEKKEFTEYVWKFYGPGQIYGHFFGDTLDKGELVAAVDERMQNKGYEGDSMDREIVRDLMIAARKEFLAKRKANY